MSGLMRGPRMQGGFLMLLMLKFLIPFVIGVIIGYIIKMKVEALKQKKFIGWIFKKLP